MAKALGFTKQATIQKKTSIGGNHSMIKTSSMNKSTKRSYKRYRGQGRKQENNMVGIDCNNTECENELCDCDPCMCTQQEPCPCCISDEIHVDGP